MKIKDAVKSFFSKDGRTERLLFHEKNDSYVTERARTPVYDIACRNGLKATLKSVSMAILKGWNRLTQGDSDTTRTYRDTLVCDSPPNLREGLHKVELSRLEGMVEIPPQVIDAAQTLSEVPHVFDEELVKIGLEYRETLPIKEAEIWCPTRLLLEIERVGSNVHYVSHRKIEAACRIHVDDSGVGANMNDPFSRMIGCDPEASPVNDRDIQMFEEHLKAQDVDESRWRSIIEEPVKFLQSGGKSTLLTDCFSYYRMKKEGKTALRMIKDYWASGYTIQLAILRDQELLKRAITNSASSVKAHLTMAAAMQKQTPRLKAAPLKEQLALAKMVFMPSMYTGKAPSIYSMITGLKCGDDPSGDRWNLPKILEDRWFGEMACNEEITTDLFGLCKKWSTGFKLAFKKSVKFNDIWLEAWEKLVEENEGRYWEGMRIPYPGGGESLCSFIREDKQAKKEEIKGQIMIAKQPFDVSAWVLPAFEGVRGSFLPSHIVRMYDSAISCKAIHNATVDGTSKIRFSIHDARGFHPHDHDAVQAAERDAFNDIMSSSIMYPKRDQVLIPKGAELLG